MTGIAIFRSRWSSMNRLGGSISTKLFMEIRGDGTPRDLMPRSIQRYPPAMHSVREYAETRRFDLMK